jgi:hypothetical protein
LDHTVRKKQPPQVTGCRFEFNRAAVQSSGPANASEGFLGFSRRSRTH